MNQSEIKTCLIYYIVWDQIVINNCFPQALKRMGFGLVGFWWTLAGFQTVCTHVYSIVMKIRPMFIMDVWWSIHANVTFPYLSQINFHIFHIFIGSFCGILHTFAVWEQCVERSEAFWGDLAKGFWSISMDSVHF